MATLDKWTTFNYFDIWEPKWSTKRVLLKASRVGAHNKIVFSKAPSLGTDPFYVSGKAVKKYPKIYNGGTWCYDVPLKELEPLVLTTNSELDLR